MTYKHECWGCPYRKTLYDDAKRPISFCMFSQSMRYLQDVDIASECEMDNFAETVFRNKDK